MKKILKPSDLNMSLGSIIGLLVFLVTALFAQWEPDVRLTYDSNNSIATYNNARCIATNGDTVHVVWKDERDGNQEIYYKRSLDMGSTWEPDARLTSEPAGSMYPTIAVSGSTVHVVWMDGRDGIFGNWELYYKQSLDGGTTWGPDISLTDTLNAPRGNHFPAVAVSGTYVHVVWREALPIASYWEIHYMCSTDGGTTWGPETRLTYDPAERAASSIAVSGSMIHIVWTDWRDAGYSEIFYKRSTDGGTTWGPDIQLTFTNPPERAMAPCLAVSGSKIDLVWMDNRRGVANWEIFYMRSTDGGTNWSSDTLVLSDSAYSAEFPSVEVSGSNVHVVWYDLLDGNHEVYYKRSTDGGITWSPDTRLTNDPGLSMSCAIAISGSAVHVVWQDDRDGNREIYYKHNPTGNVGVNEDRQGDEESRRQGDRVTPNPFISFTTVPGYENERFALYDISGKMVGQYQGHRIGEGLSAGVYFLVPKAKNAKPVRIVKVR